MKCKWHMCQNEIPEKSKSKNFCSRKCGGKFSVQRRRIKLKMKAVEYKGGKCEICGYKKCIDAFEFHHKDPGQKDFGIASDGITLGWESVRKEIEKCMLLCANCHREIHAATKATNYIIEEAKQMPFNIKIEKQIYLCEDCGSKVSQFDVKKCLSCWHESLKNKNYPSDDILQKLIWEIPRTQLAKQFGVSETALRQHCKKRKMTQPGRGYWNNKK